MQSALNEKRAIEKAKKLSHSGETCLAWYQHESERYFACTYDEYLKVATMQDSQIAGFENGEQTF